jgi:histidinol-phosphatase (PHP family)
MNFPETLNGSTLYTFHSHTEFCDGRATMEAFARKAVEMHFTHYGFTPHSPIPIESSCNMHRDNVERYLAEVQRIRADYGDRCQFYAGMEVDYLGDECGPADEYFRSLPLDYTIGSVHFIKNQEGHFVDIDGRFESFKLKMQQHFGNDIRYVVETFYEQSHRMLTAGGFDILGHLDKIGHNASQFQPGIEDEPWYRALADALVDHAIASGVVVEINTKAWESSGRIFPAPRLIERLRQAGVTLLVNSDAHVPALINAGRAHALALLNS